MDAPEHAEAEASAQPNKSPIRICVLGSEAAGKTCFLGGLAILSEPNRDSHIHVIGAEEDTEATNGSPSQQFLNEVAATLRAGDWPPPTTLTREIELDIRFRDRLFRFDVIDYPGESFREALNELDESRQKVLLDHMIKADFLLLLVPDASFQVMKLCRHFLRRHTVRHDLAKSGNTLRETEESCTRNSHFPLTGPSTAGITMPR